MVDYLSSAALAVLCFGVFGTGIATAATHCLKI
jgi:hypothetical protein